MDMMSEEMTDRLNESIDVCNLGCHIQSCTEMKYMQLSSDVKVIGNLGLPCVGLFEIGFMQYTQRSIYF